MQRGMEVAHKVLHAFGVEKAESLLVLTILSLACLLGMPVHHDVLCILLQS